MTTVKIYYLSGDVVPLDSCATVGSIMTQVAMMHDRFACDIAVVCLDSGEDLTDPPSQAPPPAVSVVLKQADDPPTREDLILTLLLHAEHEDIATCTRALDAMRRLNPLFRGKNLFQLVLYDDAVWQQKTVDTLVRVGLDGAQALHGACYMEDRKIVEGLLAAGVPPDSEDKLGRTPLIIACKRNCTAVVKILLSNGALVNRVDKFGYTPLIFASMTRKKQIVRILLSNSAQVNQEDRRGETSLIKASRSGEKVVVKMLLSNGAGDDRENQHFQKALRVASDKDMKEILRAHGAQR